MTIEKLDTGSYRIRQQYNGKRYQIVVKYKPTQKEATILMAEKMKLAPEEKKNVPKTFKNCTIEYINDRRSDSILSPSTIRGYMSLINSSMDSKFVNKNIYDITPKDIQVEITRYSQEHAPKSVRNMHGLISTIMHEYRPSFVYDTKLPELQTRISTTPSIEEVKMLLEATSGTPFHVMVQLGILGLRSGEMQALTLDDMKQLKSGAYILTINKDRIRNEKNQWVIKNIPKNNTSNRKIELPKELAEEILAQKGFCLRGADTFLRRLHDYQDALEIKRTRVHDLRHYCATYLHYLGYPDKYIQAYCGWKTNYTMNKIYKEAFEDEFAEMNSVMGNNIINCIKNDKLSAKSGHKNGHKNSQDRINTDGIAN